jgi:hypothetical protein
MKTQWQRPKKQGAPARALARTCRPAFGPPELDTYKQLLQPNSHAGSSLFWGFPETLNLKEFLCPEKTIFQDFRSPKRQRVLLPNLTDFLRLLDGRFSAMGGVMRLPAD